MYVKCNKRIISDNNLVKVRVVVSNDSNEDDDDEIEIYSELEFSHGYAFELNLEIPEIIRNNLDKITDRYATINLKLEYSDIKVLNIPKKSGDRLQISVVDVMEFDSKWNLSEEEKIAICNLLKKRGNYKAGLKNWSGAFKNYHIAVKYLKDAVCVIESSHCHHSLARDLLISCMNNASISCLKLNSGHSLCVKYCNKVLSIDNTNTKAFYRKAKALFELKDYAGALDSIEKCLMLETDEKARKEIACMKTKCQEKHKTQKLEDKVLCKDIFDKMSDIARKEPDDNKSTIPYDIESWDNAMADKMISITEELEAFGEEMPPRIHLNNRNGETCTIVEEEDDFV